MPRYKSHIGHKDTIYTAINDYMAGQKHNKNVAKNTELLNQRSIIIIIKLKTKLCNN